MSKVRNKYSHRNFSESFKRSIVKDLDNGKIRVRDVIEEYSVSKSSVYRWIWAYSIHKKRQSRVIVEDRSDQSRVKELEAQVKELQAALGRKQMEVEYQAKLMELASKEHNIDFEKKDEPPH